MGAHQDSSFSQLRQTKSIWALLSTLSILLFLFFTTAAYHVSNLHHAQKTHASVAISEITALIESHKSHLSTRDIEAAELEARSIGSFFSGLASSVGSGVESAAEGAAESVASDLGLGNITSLIKSITGLFAGNGSLIDNALGELATPAKFLGMGLAMGGLTGLNMTTSMNTSATGVDQVAMNLGSGLTSTIFKSPGVSNIFSGSSSSSSTGTKSAVQDSSSNLTESDGGFLGGSTGALGQAVLALSQGLGSGAVTGLKLNTAATGSTFNTTGLNGIAGNFGQGLTSAILGGLNVSLPSFSISSMMSSVTKRELRIDSGSEDADFFTMMRREFDTLDSNRKRSLSSGLVSTISDLALGLGSGLGQGTAVGLGFQNNLTATTSGLSGITQNFASGLTSSFLSNGTVSKLIKSLSSKSTSSSNSTAASNSSSSTGSSSGLSGLTSGLGGTVDIAKVAEGFAVGLISGAGSQVSSLQLIAANTSSFDDSVDGAATGFGRGLGSEGAKLVSSLITNGLPKGLTLKKRDAEPAIVHLAGSSSSQRLRGRGNLITTLGRRASANTTTAVTTNATDIASVITSLNASSINPLLQNGVEALTCSGIGGLFGVFIGLVDSKTINLDSMQNTSSNLTLPNELFIVRNAGNTYSVNPSQGVDGASVNGFTIEQILLLGGVHIIFAIAAWFVAIPLFLLFSSTHKLALFFQPPTKASSGNISSSTKTQKYLFWSIVPLSIIGFVFGIVIVGTGKHMRGAHQILALFLLLLTIISGAFHLKLNPSLLKSSPSISKATPPTSKNLLIAYKVLIALIFIMATATLLTGFGDMTILSMCIVQELITVTGFVAIGMATMATWMLAIGIYALKTWAISRFPKQSSPSSKFQSKKVNTGFSYPGQGMIGLREKDKSANGMGFKSGPVEDVYNGGNESYKNTMKVELRNGKMVEKSYMELES